MKEKIKKKSGESGVIIIFTSIILGILVSISLGLVAIFTPKIRLIGEIRNSVVALYGAESGLEWCLYKNLMNPSPVPPLPIMSNGATFQLTPADCSGKTFKSVGTFRDVTRAIQADLP